MFCFFFILARERVDARRPRRRYPYVTFGARIGHGGAGNEQETNANARTSGGGFFSRGLGEVNDGGVESMIR